MCAVAFRSGIFKKCKKNCPLCKGGPAQQDWHCCCVSTCQRVISVNYKKDGSCTKPSTVRDHILGHQVAKDGKQGRKVSGEQRQAQDVVEVKAIATIWTGQSMRGRWSSVYSFVLLWCHCVFTTRIHFETYVCITNLTTVYNKQVYFITKSCTTLYGINHPPPSSCSSTSSSRVPCAVSLARLG